LRSQCQVDIVSLHEQAGYEKARYEQAHREHWQALREQALREQALQDNVRDFVCCLDNVDLTIFYFSTHIRTYVISVEA
jgi:hypothetical protein